MKHHVIFHLDAAHKKQWRFFHSARRFREVAGISSIAGSKFHHPNQKGVEPKMKCSRIDGCQLQTSSTFKKGDLGKRT